MAWRVERSGSHRATRMPDRAALRVASGQPRSPSSAPRAGLYRSSSLNTSRRICLRRMRSQVRPGSRRPRHDRHLGAASPMQSTKPRRAAERLFSPAVRRADPHPAWTHACPIPAGLVLVIEIVLSSPTTRAPKPGERPPDPAEHGRLPPVPSTVLLARRKNEAASGPLCSR